MKRAHEVRALIRHGSLVTVEGNLLTVTYGRRAKELAQIMLSFLRQGSRRP